MRFEVTWVRTDGFASWRIRAALILVAAKAAIPVARQVRGLVHAGYWNIRTTQGMVRAP